MNLFGKSIGGLLGVLIAAAAVATYKSPLAAQIGTAGLGMEVIKSKKELAETTKLNVVPAPIPAADPNGPRAIDAYKNVQVLGHLSSGEFTRMMTAISSWVAPNDGCAYCHAPKRDAQGQVVKDEDGYVQADLNNLQSDELYTKRVARRMLQMTMHINQDWKSHVKQTGVTCYTCHRGNPVPANIWYDIPESPTEDGMLGAKAGQNSPSNVAGLTSLPSASLRPFLADNNQIRVQATEAIGSGDRSSIKQTEWTYSLMIHITQSLGVNCTFCHNTRSFGAWDASPPQRTQAWFGIRMVRDLNIAYLEPLGSTFPAQRHGELGDGPKLSCATCHNGAYKPFLGVSMLQDYPALAEAKPQPLKADTSAGAANTNNTQP